MSIWKKNTDPLEAVASFTVGNDKAMDVYLAGFDVLGSLAHVQMLQTIGLLTKAEWLALQRELIRVHTTIVENPNFQLPNDVEDIHSYVEALLTEKLGDVGKKIHSARSRNDQVMVDIKLFLRQEIKSLTHAVKSLFDLLQQKSQQHQQDLIPGYTHLQLAMPSSIGLWLGAYAESLVDDMALLEAAFRVVNKNPLGSAAGYGASFPINRSLTTQLLGFEQLNYNVVYAQMGRGKTERVVASALSNIADSLARLCMDACLFMNQNFGFISFPAELTTGSSIMPHKQNPDVLELVRGHCNRIKALPNEIMLMTTNMPSGYHRDWQLLKENLFPAFAQLKNCLQMMGLMLSNLQVKTHILDDQKYQHLFTVEAVNALVLQGIPFRDAYRQIGAEVETGTFSYQGSLHHTHEGSIGNLCNAAIANMMDAVLLRFPFDQIDVALANLLRPAL
jgi:argininosuccinate lyase